MKQQDKHQKMLFNKIDFALMGGKLKFKEKLNKNYGNLIKERYYITTDKKYFLKFGEAFKHQKELSLNNIWIS